MKRFLNTTFAMLVFALAANAQLTYAEFTGSEKTYLGIDYTKATFVNAEAFTTPSDFVRLMQEWNTFVEREPEKYDLNKAFSSKNVTINLEQAIARNSEIDTEKMVAEKANEVSREEVEQIAKSYDLSGIEGLAILMVVESYSKPKVEGTFWFVVIDAASKKVVFANRYTEKPGGFGIKNYWAKTQFLFLDDAPKTLKKDMK